MAAAETSNALHASMPALSEGVAEIVEADGYAIVEGVLDAAACARYRAEIDRVEAEREVPMGGNDFEGFRTRRIFDLIQFGPLFRELVLEEKLLGTVEAILGEDFLLSGTTSMHLFPGETPQLLHADDGMITLPRPHIATLVTCLFAITDFEDANGATLLVAGSHKDPAMPRPGEAFETVSASMPAGSMLVLHGSTWHGGGENSTADVERYGVSIQFVAGWCRQQQNLQLGTAREAVAEYPRRLQELIGYSIYKNVMGHVHRQHPLQLLGVNKAPKMVWEKMDREEKP